MVYAQPPSWTALELYSLWSVSAQGFPETYKYPTRLRKYAVRASFPFFGLCLSDSQRCRLWRLIPIREANARSVSPDSCRYRFSAFINSSGLIALFSGNRYLRFGRPPTNMHHLWSHCIKRQSKDRHGERIDPNFSTRCSVTANGGKRST